MYKPDRRSAIGCPRCAATILPAATACPKCGMAADEAATQSARLHAGRPRKSRGYNAAVMLVIGLVCIYLAVVSMMLVSKAIRPNAGETDNRYVSPEPTELPLSAGEGHWNGFDYVFATRPEGTVVTFTPFLPAADATVVAAMRHVATHILKIDMSSGMAYPEGRNIVLRSRGRRVVFLIVKEDNGQVHSFVMRRD